MTTLDRTLDVAVPDQEKRHLLELDEKLQQLLAAKRSGAEVTDEAVLFAYTCRAAESRRLQLQVLSQREQCRNHLGMLMLDFLRRQDNTNPEVTWLLHALGESYQTPTKEQVLQAFRAEIYERGQHLGANDSLRWNEIAYGFALARGCSQPVAQEIMVDWYDYCRASDPA
ncbi:hypothetical protein [Pseudomonas sp. S1(2024)]|uniref:hypothetical protein n=1 Tax=Pseudomonas sp. S1(2024) TaxID=3390191 RepID=UPI003978B676